MIPGPRARSGSVSLSFPAGPIPKGLAALLLGLLLSGGSGCEAGRDRDGVDAGRDAATDAEEPCETSMDCDDGFACTLDACAAGNVCEHDPIDARCDESAGARCVVGRGCVASDGPCEDASDCDDGLRCNGEERCIRQMCVAGLPFDCDDGNECTVDRCVETGGTCRYEVAPGCDAGVASVDGGADCAPFDPVTGYAESFTLLPGLACDAGLGAGYSVSSASFEVEGDTLTVVVGPFTLTESPAPSGASFDVTGATDCATVRLEGTFECDGAFRGTWTAAHEGACGRCGSTSTAVAGRR